jgi:predicted transcriptional regulator
VNRTAAPRGSVVKVNGYALRLVRTLRGRTIGSLARPSGVSTSFLARVERGVKHGMRRDVFDRIAAELAVQDARALMAEPHREVCAIPAQRAGDERAS